MSEKFRNNKQMTLESWLERCPVCGRVPDIDKCGPLAKGEASLGWYAACYSLKPVEHHVGVNADTKLDARKAWNQEAQTIRQRAQPSAMDL